MAARFCSRARPLQGLPGPKDRREHKGVTGSMARTVRWGLRGLQGLLGQLELLRPKAIPGRPERRGRLELPEQLVHRDP